MLILAVPHLFIFHLIWLEPATLYYLYLLDEFSQHLAVQWNYYYVAFLLKWAWLIRTLIADSWEKNKEIGTSHLLTCLRKVTRKINIRIVLFSAPQWKLNEIFLYEFCNMWICNLNSKKRKMVQTQLNKVIWLMHGQTDAADNCHTSNPCCHCGMCFFGWSATENSGGAIRRWTSGSFIHLCYRVRNRVRVYGCTKIR